MCRAAGEPFPAVHSWPSRTPDPLAAVRGGVLLAEHLVDGTRRTRRPAPATPGTPRTPGHAGDWRSGPGFATGGAVQEAAWPAPVITDYDDDLVVTFPGPVIWVLDDATPSLGGVILDRLNSADLTYLLHPRSLPAPDRPGVRLVQVCDGPLSLNAALGVL